MQKKIDSAGTFIIICFVLIRKSWQTIFLSIILLKWHAQFGWPIQNLKVAVHFIQTILAEILLHCPWQAVVHCRCVCEFVCVLCVARRQCLWISIGPWIFRTVTTLYSSFGVNLNHHLRCDRNQFIYFFSGACIRGMCDVVMADGWCSTANVCIHKHDSRKRIRMLGIWETVLCVVWTAAHVATESASFQLLPLCANEFVFRFAQTVSKMRENFVRLVRPLKAIRALSQCDILRKIFPRNKFQPIQRLPLLPKCQNPFHNLYFFVECRLNEHWCIGRRTTTSLLCALLCWLAEENTWLIRFKK